MLLFSSYNSYCCYNTYISYNVGSLEATLSVEHAYSIFHIPLYFEATVSTPETPSEAGTSSAVDLNKRRQRQEMKAENQDDPRFPVMSENMIYEEGTSVLYHLENVAEVTQTQASTQPAVEDYAELQCFPGNSREANIEDCYWTLMTPQKKGRDTLDQ
ncbi:uncharacterized protein LOC131696664 isoform X2 [Acipenser ruthenus]|uniref:uncharacterized protein LOC131696664 isoform X2 n=1 Tax=Acipenser ruthenus TaxID=7906 RepID=UPI002741DBC8|nr:uncharacterized protein LOC131696664 isoform X2 [Acipenser ruthenus]